MTTRRQRSPTAKGEPASKDSRPDERHKWEFKARFRRQAFGWQSLPAITRIKQAVAEIKKAAKRDPVLAAEGAIVLLERLSPALERVDGSSGSIGAAVNGAIAAVVPIIAAAPANATTRDAWLDRLWEAYQNDAIPYIESLGDSWGALCATKETASAWGDRLMDDTKAAWSSDRGARIFFKGTTNCLSALVAAERYGDVLALLDLAPYQMWHYRKFGVNALSAMGKKAEAIRYAEEGRGINDSPLAIALACEAILLSSGLADEAYRRYGLVASQGGSYLATSRNVAKKYPHKAAGEILADLVNATPGNEGKWFAAAKEAGLYDEAVALASRSPCDPKTLTRAARDFAESQPAFAASVGLLAIHWLVKGYGYEITSADVWDAYRAALAAADRLDRTAHVKARLREMVLAESTGERFVTKVLGTELGV